MILFTVLRFLNNIRIVLSRPRQIQNFPSEASDVDMTSSHRHQHHQLTQSAEDEQMIYENCKKLELLVTHLFFERHSDEKTVDDALTELGKFVLSGEEQEFLSTLVQETSRLIANIRNLGLRQYHQDLQYILQLVFRFLQNKETQWVPVAQCITQLASLNYIDLAKRSLAQLKSTVSSNAEAQKNSKMEELFDHITKIIQENEQHLAQKGSPVTPGRGVSPGSYYYSPTRTHYYPPYHHGYHPYVTSNHQHSHPYGRHAYTSNPYMQHNVPQQSSGGSHPYASNPYVQQSGDPTSHPYTSNPYIQHQYPSQHTL